MSNLEKLFLCHFYSALRRYENIANNFSGGLIKCIREVSLYHERPFEHEFFLRIAQLFSFIKELTLIYWKPQNNKRCRKSNYGIGHLSIIEYPHLIYLTLMKIRLNNFYLIPNGVHLHINYESLEKVTQFLQERQHELTEIS